MDTIITMRNTKSEMLEHIRVLELRCTEAARERVHLRERISILEGSAALRVAPPARQPLKPGEVVIERRGQTTIKRWMPAR